MANNPGNSDTRNKDNPKDDDDITFYFFYNIVKKIILNRHDVGDVCTLSCWLKALEDNKNKSVRNEYIKLMVLALKYPKLVCPFKDAPPETIDPLENGVIEMSRKFLNNEGTATCPGGINYDEPDPPMSVAVSNDKRQYASSQVIPNVGVQCYFAYSDDHIYNWTLPPQINIPKGGPHARHVDWERSMAGIVSELYTPSTDNLEPRNVKDDEATSHSISGSGFSKRKRAGRSRLRINEDTDICQVMHIEQQNRNINEDFVWNDSSLLTGEIILGAEMCSDRKVDAQVKSQKELDEEVMSSYDKLYPGDFKTYVDSSIVNDIIPVKNVAMDSGDRRIQEMTLDEKSTKKRTDIDCGLKTQHNNHGKMFTDSKNFSNSNRQHAGQETKIVYNCDPIKKINTQNHNDISELTPDLANNKNHKNRNYVERRYSKTNDSSTDDILHFKRPIYNRERLKQQKDISSTVLERDMMVYKQQINMADKCAKSIVQNFDQESKNINLKPNHDDLDSSSDA